MGVLNMNENRRVDAYKENKDFISTAVFGVTKQRHGKLNVAAYIRVSTDSSDQENSYEAQEQYFHRLIAERKDWNFAGIYSDYGISGTNSGKRIGFQRLLRHCQDGKIDRIMCKSISRFSRNTADFMIALRILKECDVTILFEKENLDTSDPTSEFILTTLGAIAQEESRSISGNIKLGNKMRFQRGDVRNVEMYGYRYSGKIITSESGYKYKEIIVFEEEARVVREIFREAAFGKSYAEIARELNYDHIPAPDSVIARKRRKNSKKGQLNSHLEDGWTAERISSMLRNERYAGDVLAQKTYTVDYLTHTVRQNKGEVRQYHIQNHHPAIVNRELFEEVQKVILAKSNGNMRKKKIMRAFSGRLICNECGRFYNVRNTRSYPIWFCPSTTRNNGKSICHAEKVYEEQIIRVVRRAVIERFYLTIQPIRDDVNVADIMSGRFVEEVENFSSAAEYFVRQMKERLEKFQRLDFVERDRCFYKKRISAIDVLDGDLHEKRKLIEQLNYLETYWKELEKDHEYRKAALEWMEYLPNGKDGTVAFLNGLTSDHCKAFILSISIQSPIKYMIHWFDDTTTLVEMDSNIEDYRQTVSYYNKSCRQVY